MISLVILFVLIFCLDKVVNLLNEIEKVREETKDDNLF